MKICFLILFLVSLVGCVADLGFSSHPTMAPEPSWPSAGYNILVADQAKDVTPVALAVECTSSCDDNNACTVDTCDTKTGTCVNSSKEWDCWPCQSNQDCVVWEKTCQEGQIHKDGYDYCLPDKTCHTFHQAEACPDDNNPCTVDECSYNDDNDVICEHQVIPNCKP